MITNFRFNLIIALNYFFICQTYPAENSFHLLNSDSTEGISGIIGIIQKTENLVQGEILKAEKKYKRDIAVWKINVIAVTGGALSIEFSDNQNELFLIEGNEGPFDYEILPLQKSVSFSRAKKTAEDYSGQKILKWNLKKNKEVWEYSFWVFTKSGKAQIRVNAESGELILKKKKK